MRLITKISALIIVFRTALLLLFLYSWTLIAASKDNWLNRIHLKKIFQLIEWSIIVYLILFILLENKRRQVIKLILDGYITKLFLWHLSLLQFSFYEIKSWNENTGIIMPLWDIHLTIKFIWNHYVLRCSHILRIIIKTAFFKTLFLIIFLKILHKYIKILIICISLILNNINFKLILLSFFFFWKTWIIKKWNFLHIFNNYIKFLRIRFKLLIFILNFIEFIE